MGRGYRIVSQNRQCVRTPLSASINRHLDFRVFICRKRRSLPITYRFHWFIKYHPAEAGCIFRTSERYGYTPDTQGFPNDCLYHPENTRYSGADSGIADSAVIEWNAKWISWSGGSWAKTWWTKKRDRGRIYQRDSVHQRKADGSRMEPGIRSMVPSQIFRSAKNQKGYQHLCFKNHWNRRHQTATPPDYPVSGRRGRCSEIHRPTPLFVRTIRQEWGLDCHWADYQWHGFSSLAFAELCKGHSQGVTNQTEFVCTAHRKNSNIQRYSRSLFQWTVSVVGYTHSHWKEVVRHVGYINRRALYLFSRLDNDCAIKSPNLER